MKIIVFFVILIITTSCGSVENNRSSYHKMVSTFNIKEADFKIYAKYWSKCENIITSHLDKFNDPNELQALFYECLYYSRKVNYKNKDQDFSPYHASLNSILYRLAKIKTDDSVKILVSLYHDSTVGWDAGSSISASNAVVKCGKLALPYLNKSKKEDLRLISLINKGITIAF